MPLVAKESELLAAADRPVNRDDSFAHQPIVHCGFCHG